MPQVCHKHCPPERGGLAVALTVVIAAVVVVKVVVAILTVLLITLAVLAGLALLGGAAYAIAAVRSGRRSAPALPPRRQHAPLSTPGRRSLPAGERHLHLHLHGLDPGAIAAIIRQQHDDARPAIKEDP